MGGMAETGGGRTKSQNFELNLVPFIDLLSVNITFLIATAVWVQIMTMQVDQAIQDPNAPPPPVPEEPPNPPLTVHITANNVWAGRKIEEGKTYAKIAGDYDWDSLEVDLKADHEKFPEDTQVIIVTDDGIEYSKMITVLDITRALGYDKTLLGGGPAQAVALPLPTGGPQ